MKLSQEIQTLLSRFQEMEEKINEKEKETSALEKQKRELNSQAYSLSSDIFDKIKKDNLILSKFKVGDIVFAKSFGNIKFEIVKCQYKPNYDFKPSYLLEDNFEPFYYMLEVYDNCDSINEYIDKFLDEGCCMNDLELSTPEKEQEILETQIKEYEDKINSLKRKK